MTEESVERQGPARFLSGWDDAASSTNRFHKATRLDIRCPFTVAQDPAIRADSQMSCSATSMCCDPFATVMTWTRPDPLSWMQ